MDYWCKSIFCNKKILLINWKKTKGELKQYLNSVCLTRKCKADYFPNKKIKKCLQWGEEILRWSPFIFLRWLMQGATNKHHLPQCKLLRTQRADRTHAEAKILAVEYRITKAKPSWEPCRVHAACAERFYWNLTAQSWLVHSGVAPVAFGATSIKVWNHVSTGSINRLHKVTVLLHMICLTCVLFLSHNRCRLRGSLWRVYSFFYCLRILDIVDIKQYLKQCNLIHFYW